jgi:hypothetical protein
VIDGDGGPDQLGVFGRIGGGWMRIIRQEGRWVVGQLHVLPESNENEAEFGRLMSIETRSEPAAAPTGGLTARHVRRIPFGDGAGAALVNVLQTQAAKIVRAYRREGSRGRLRLAQVAQLYVDALNRRSRRPNAEVAAQLKISVSAVRDAIHQAREQQLLSRPRQQGVMGGELTRKAPELLGGQGGREAG